MKQEARSQKSSASGSAYLPLRRSADCLSRVRSLMISRLRM